MKIGPKIDLRLGSFGLGRQIERKELNWRRAAQWRTRASCIVSRFRFSIFFIPQRRDANAIPLSVQLRGSIATGLIFFIFKFNFILAEVNFVIATGLMK